MTKINQMRPGFEPIEASHWSRTATPLEPSPEIVGPVTTDILVIGGGYTGLSAALHAAEGGASVVLLEARQPGWGASGRNAAQVCPMLQSTPDKVVKQLGVDLGDRVNRFVAQSGQALFDLIERHAIPCAPRHTGHILVARSEKSLAPFVQVARQMATYGAPVEILGKKELQTYVISDRYAGGVRYLDGGLIQPLSYARGLAVAAQLAGVSIFGNSAALSRERRNGGWRVRTAKGEVLARTVIIGAGAYLDGDLCPQLQEVGYPVTAALLSSQPLPDWGKSILPKGGPIVDLDDQAITSPAIDLEGRLTMTVLLQGSGVSLKDLMPVADRRLRKAFPQLAPVRWERHCFGRMMVTPDHLPRIIRLGAGMYAGVGCQGLGVTYATGTGRELARLALGAAEDTIDLPVSELTRAPMAKLMPAVMRHALFPLLNRYTA